LFFIPKITDKGSDLLELFEIVTGGSVFLETVYNKLMYFASVQLPKN